MADQEFLASFAVDIDEAGVARLQTILSENRELAEGVSAAFDAASESIRSFAEQMGLVSDFSAGGITAEGMSGRSRFPPAGPGSSPPGSPRTTASKASFPRRSRSARTSRKRSAADPVTEAMLL